MSLLPTLQPEPVDKIICRLCRRQFSKYTCPSCNVPYCSLTCFRSESHIQCSETFYKKELESDIHSNPSKSAQERSKMMDVLKRFEEGSADQDMGFFDSDDEGEGDTSGLAARLEKVDLDTVSPDAIWHLLTEEEQRKFLRTLNNPDSELAQQLLASEELEKARRDPWWESHDLEGSMTRRRGEKPEPINVPASMVKPYPTGQPLVFNMAAICLAYAYITRHLAFSPLASLPPDSADHEQARKIVSKITPFLVDRGGTTLYQNMSSMITDVWSRFDEGDVPPELLSTLFGDVAELLRPLPVVSMDQESGTASGEINISSHGHAKTLYVLSDLMKLFERRKHVHHKLLFYAAQILSTPSVLLRTVSEDAFGRSRADKQGDRR